MRRSTFAAVAAVALFAGAFAVSLTGVSGYPFTVASVLALALVLTLRSREAAAAHRYDLDHHGGGWGPGVGPVPGGSGGVIAPVEFPDRLVRTYRARSTHRIREMAGRDEAVLGRRGYMPVSERLEPGRWRWYEWTGAVLACLVLVGFVLLAYMTRNSPGGTLTKTYALSGARRAGDRLALAEAAAQLEDLIAQREAGTLSPEDLAAAKAETIASL